MCVQTAGLSVGNRIERKMELAANNLCAAGKSAAVLGTGYAAAKVAGRYGSRQLAVKTLSPFVKTLNKFADSIGKIATKEIKTGKLLGNKVLTSGNGIFSKTLLLLSKGAGNVAKALGKHPRTAFIAAGLTLVGGALFAIGRKHAYVKGAIDQKYIDRANMQGVV